jgi:hypothetical protein
LGERLRGVSAYQERDDERRSRSLKEPHALSPLGVIGDGATLAVAQL